MGKEDFKEWLSDLIDVSEKCLPLWKKPSDEYDKLMFQLKAKLKTLD